MGDETRPELQGGRSGVYTVSLRLTAGSYRKLRRFAAAQEEASGRRQTHQAILEKALVAFLQRAEMDVD